MKNIRLLMLVIIVLVFCCSTIATAKVLGTRTTADDVYTISANIYPETPSYWPPLFTSLVTVSVSGTKGPGIGFTVSISAVATRPVGGSSVVTDSSGKIAFYVSPLLPGLMNCSNMTVTVDGYSFPWSPRVSIRLPQSTTTWSGTVAGFASRSGVGQGFAVEANGVNLDEVEDTDQKTHVITQQEDLRVKANTDCYADSGRELPAASVAASATATETCLVELWYEQTSGVIPSLLYFTKAASPTTSANGSGRHGTGTGSASIIFSALPKADCHTSLTTTELPMTAVDSKSNISDKEIISGSTKTVSSAFSSSSILAGSAFASTERRDVFIGSDAKGNLGLDVGPFYFDVPK